MATKGWVLLPLTLFLFPLLIESRSPPSAPPHHPHHHHQPFEFIKNLEGCHKGETVKGIHKLKQYLEHFGYLPRHSTNTTNTNSHKNVGADNDSFDELLELAIKSYQRNYHLNVTGKLDVETAGQMMKPRCGVADIINGKSSMRSGKGRHLYTFFPNSPRWPSSKTRLTYGFLQGVQVISLQNHRTICKSAFEKWSAVSHFTFEEAQNVASADIKIGFFSSGHGDNAPFDGAGGVLAHAFAPTRGWFHYDADENWAINPTANAFDVESVTVHEIGHLLGLGHSQDRNAIMFPSIGPGQKKPADPNFTSPVTGHLLPPCLAATPLPASGYGSHPLQRPLPPVPANGHCCHLLSPLLLLPYLCKLSVRPATASSPPSAPGHCDLLQIRGHFQTTGHPQTSGHSPYNLHNLLTSRPVHLNPYSAATTAASHPTCKHPPEPAPTCTSRTNTHLNRLNFSP
ncbi:hypothetical protein MRB53_014941 [Persea americana]|uniref:Uncharacterized protein n=1 Tax=Persea americana TaxID=3435 RepID=A0ACC2KCB1_PERAE|nr:hypothetical protein MRB53_014941 [Persea americana]